MSRKKRHIIKSINRYLNYFGNNLSNQQRHVFEKNMMRDKFDEEAFEGLSKLDVQDLNNDLNELREQLSSRSNQKKIRILSKPVIRYAAAIALIIGIGGTLVYLFNTVEKYSPVAQEIKERSDTSHPKKLTDSLMVAEQAEYIEENAIKEKTEYEAEITEVTDIEKNTMAERPVVNYKASKKEHKFNFATEEKKVEVAAEEAIGELFPEAVASLDTKHIEGKSIKNLENTAIGPRLTQIEYEDAATEYLTHEEEKDEAEEYRIITGRIMSATDNAPLPGVTVKLLDSAYYVTTDYNGDFSIRIPAKDGEQLQFDYIGFESINMQIYSDTTVNVHLEENLIALEELVVVGYGGRRKSSISGSREKEVEFIDNSFIYPEPSCGKDDYIKYIRENTSHNNLPAFDKPKIVKLKFKLDEKGSISDIEVSRSQGKEFDKEAKRLLLDGPDWIPAKQNGIPVSRKVTLKVKFEPIEEK